MSGMLAQHLLALYLCQLLHACLSTRMLWQGHACTCAKLCPCRSKAELEMGNELAWCHSM